MAAMVDSRNPSRRGASVDLSTDKIFPADLWNYLSADDRHGDQEHAVRHANDQKRVDPTRHRSGGSIQSLRRHLVSYLQTRDPPSGYAGADNGRTCRIYLRCPRYQHRRVARVREVAHAFPVDVGLCCRRGIRKGHGGCRDHRWPGRRRSAVCPGFGRAGGCARINQNKCRGGFETPTSRSKEAARHLALRQGGHPWRPHLSAQEGGHLLEHHEEPPEMRAMSVAELKKEGIPFRMQALKSSM